MHKTPVYKYLNGDRDVYKNYHHYNYYGVTNEKRINNVVNSDDFSKNKGSILRYMKINIGKRIIILKNNKIKAS